MDNDTNIKSKDLCERCVCRDEFCKPLPCPYFREAKGEIELRPICTESTALDDLIRDLRRMRVETGSLVCIGCGHEHNCSIHGCAIISKAIAVLETCAGLLPGRKGVPDCQDPNNAAK